MTVLTVLSRKKEESSPRYARVAGAGRRCHRLVMPGQEEQGGVIASLCRCTGGACSRCTRVYPVVYASTRSPLLSLWEGS